MKIIAKTFATLITALFCALNVSASENIPEFKFRPDGTFKIMQATDLHLCYTTEKGETSKEAVENLYMALQAEKPNLLIITGDAVYSAPDEPAWDALLAAISETKTPFVWLQGNHDTEHDFSLAQISAKVNSANGSIVKLNDRGEMTDLCIPIKGNSGKNEAILYLFDSHNYSPLPQVDGYAWLQQYQIDWYRKEATNYRTANNGSPLPALAFMHIPTPEWQHAFEQKEDHNCVGIRMERECYGKVNSGLVAACLEQGDIMGMFAGHDHDNDYISNHLGIAFGYGRYSGAKTVYTNLLQGHRIITLLEGQRDFTSYIRLIDGRIISNYKFSDAPKSAAQREDEAYVASGIDLSQWMKKIPDNRQLNRVSIPATHDSGATRASHDLKCQVVGVNDQLMLGIRGFDFRLRALTSDSLGVFHNDFFQFTTWEHDVLPIMVDFLKENPSETIIVTVKCEGENPEKDAKLLAKSLADTQIKNFIVQDFNPRATLGELRGKILFFFRTAPAMKNYPGALCDGWGESGLHNVTLTGSNGKSAQASVEDFYAFRDKWDSPNKVMEIMSNINKALDEPQNSPNWHISFASASAAPGDGPRDFAEIINPAIASELQQIKGSCGIVPFDMAATPAARALTRTLIISNY